MVFAMSPSSCQWQAKVMVCCGVDEKIVRRVSGKRRAQGDGVRPHGVGERGSLEHLTALGVTASGK